MGGGGNLTLSLTCNRLFKDVTFCLICLFVCLFFPPRVLACLFLSQLDAEASLWRPRQKCFEAAEAEICADGTKVAACAHHLQVRGVELVAMETIENGGVLISSALLLLLLLSFPFPSSSPDITCSPLPRRRLEYVTRCIFSRRVRKSTQTLARMGCERVLFLRSGFQRSQGRRACWLACREPAPFNKTICKPYNHPTPPSLLNSVQILITNIQTLILSGLIKLQLLIGSQKEP